MILNPLKDNKVFFQKYQFLKFFLVLKMNSLNGLVIDDRKRNNNFTQSQFLMKKYCKYFKSLINNLHQIAEKRWVCKIKFQLSCIYLNLYVEKIDIERANYLKKNSGNNIIEYLKKKLEDAKNNNVR